MPEYYRGRKRTTTVDPIPVFGDLKFTKVEMSKFTSRETEAATTTAAIEVPITTPSSPLRQRNKVLKYAKNEHDNDGWSLEMD